MTFFIFPLLFYKIKSLLWQWIKKINNKPTISEADIELEYEKITVLKRWYDLNFIKLEFNLNEIQKILEIQTLNPNNDYNNNICKNIKYLFTWLISIVSSMTLDSYFDIITAQISANKKIDFIKDLKLLITKENIIVAIIAQIGFSFKINITDFCWEKFKNTYTYQALSYICNFPKKCYQSVYSNNSIFQLSSNITEENLEKLVKNYYEKFDKNIKIIEKINIKLNDTINTSNRLNINKINNSQLPPLLKTLQKIESNIISIPIN